MSLTEESVCGFASLRQIKTSLQKGFFKLTEIMKYMVGAMVSMHACIKHRFEPRSGQTNEYIIDICCFSA